MALVGYLTQLLFSSLGLAKDAALDAVGTYARLVKRALGYALVVGFIGLMLIIGGATYQQPHIMAAGIVVFTVLAIAIIFLSLPLVELTAYAVELGVAKRTLRLAGIVSGWLLIVSLVAYTSPADSSLFTRVLISALAFVPSYLLFGREATRTVLGTKLAVVLAAMAFGMLLPRTSAVMTTFLAYVDRSLSGVVDSKFTEIKFESNTLDHVQMFASDGTPLYWCRVARERPVGYRCYDRNGRDPYNQEELRPISPEILSNIRTGMLSARPTSGPAATDPVNSPSRPIRTPVVRAETAPQLTAKPATIDLISPLARRGATSTGVPRWTVVAWGADSRPDVRLLEDIQTVGASIGLSRPTQALRDSFVSNGASRQVLQGDLSVLREVELGQYTDYLILAEFSSHPQRETERGPLRSVTGELRVVLVRLSDMSTSKSIRVVEGGAGADFQDAGERAYLRLMQTAKPKLDSALRGFVQ